MAETILRNTGELLDLTFYVDGVATEADGDVTVTVTRERGAVLVASTTAVDHADVGRYQYSLSPQADLDLLTVTWSGVFSGTTQTVTTQVEIVGGYYVTLAEIRAQKNLDSTTKFTAIELDTAQRAVETMIEEFCGVAFVPRYHRDVFTGDGSTFRQLSKMYPRTILAASLDGVAVADTSAWSVTRGGWLQTGSTYLTAPSYVGAENAWVAYEHGLDAPPADLKRAALIAIRANLLDDQTGHRELSIANEFGGTTRFAAINEDNPTGIPAVDGVLKRYRDRYRVPAIA